LGVHYRPRDEREADGADRLGAENDRPELERDEGALIDGRDVLGALDLTDGAGRDTLGIDREGEGALRTALGALRGTLGAR
jgi:hypothetical protein